MSTKRRGRLTKRERILALNATHRAWGAIYGKPEVAERLCQEVPAERVRKPKDVSPDAPPLEKAVLKEVITALRSDPRVARVDRRQSGVYQSGDRYVTVGTPGTLDLSGMLVGGRYFEIEVKRPGEKPKPHQAERIAAIRAQGGISGYCWSAESALALLPT